MKFEGEHLFPGQSGHFFVLLAFTASLLSTFAFFTASRKKDPLVKRSWIRYARITFFVQVASVLAVFLTIFYICHNHYFEYLYAYKHASKELEPKYLLACIWEGQEGSFLLWSIWHCVLGSILIFKSKEWQAPVMTVISLAQCFLMLMLIGIYFGDVRLGSSPFVLTRNEINGPIFTRPDYLALLKDGVGLNVLLRNYWMVIHPPVLFLGFASTIVPFAFAYAGLSTKKFGEWVKAALPWALFSGCVLSVGIMMGGKWAYESLNFGGYWAWDPVENASLVPWMIMIAGLHCMAIYNATGNSLRATYLFTILSFAFVLYATFLTRTGILGDSSVHSFTESAMAMNILIGLFALAFPIPMLVLFIKNSARLPQVHNEENISSREFWMFIGSLIFFLAALFIIAVTSLPVYNKIFGQHIADPQNREFTYNKVMVLVAVIIGSLTAIGQYFKYRQTDKKYYASKIILALGIAIGVTVIISILNPVTYFKQGSGFLGAIYLALFAAIFSVIANAMYIGTILRGNFKSAGAAIAHAGFALMIAGILISSGNRQVISDNRRTGLFMPFGADANGKQTEDPLENLTLLRDVPTQMANYTLTYSGDSAGSEKTRTFFNLNVEKKDSATGKIVENFILKPDVYRMKDNTFSSNPDIKHYLFHDIFTYISSAADKTNILDTAKYIIHEVGLKDSIYYSRGFLILNNILKNPDTGRFHFTPSDTALVADLTVKAKDGTTRKAYPLLTVSDGEIVFHDDTVFAQNLYVKLAGISDKNKFKIAVRESDVPADFITLKAYVFPYINFVWIGLIIMAAGFIMSIIRRARLDPAVGITILTVLAGALFYMFLVAN
ncbi:MAG: cytochrome c biogenesis protein CcsA [Ginsengibacter sp.]